MLVRLGRCGDGRRGVFDHPIDRPAPTIVASSIRHGGWTRGSGMLDVLVEPWEDDVKVKAQAGGNLNRIDDVTDRPMSSIMAFQPTDVYVENGNLFGPERADRTVVEKPPYRVPLMAELGDVEPNGRVVASTFAGAGGSSLGWKLAGYDVRCAVEIAATPCETYRRNFPGATVLEKSIRDVTAREILKACRVRKGELDVFDGSPPCTSFSTAGLRSKTWGQTRKHAGTEQRIDDLFFEYARLLEGIQPRCFVAENVRGLGQGAAIGYFKAILRVLRSCGYTVAVQCLDADWLGVPQHRERLFFVGVRNDLAKKLGLDVDRMHDEAFPRPLPYQYSVRDALPWLDPGNEVYNSQGTPFGDPARIAAGKATPPDRVHDGGRPAATLTAANRKAGVQARHDTGGAYGAGDITDRPAPTITSGSKGGNRHHFTVETNYEHQVIERSPDLPAPTLVSSPSHGKGGAVLARVEHDTGRKGRKARDVTDEPAPTIVNGTDDPAAGGGARQHWKVVETGDGGTVYRRKFTILECKRLCSFPDDFDLAGKFAEQWAQCGNSVPPLMMRAVARQLHDSVLARLK